MPLFSCLATASFSALNKPEKETDFPTKPRKMLLRAGGVSPYVSFSNENQITCTSPVLTQNPAILKSEFERTMIDHTGFHLFS
jgi:hypothetical protein